MHTASGPLFVVREKRVELSLFRNWCLKPARLPFRHSRMETAGTAFFRSRALRNPGGNCQSIFFAAESALLPGRRPGAVFSDVFFDVLPVGIVRQLGVRAKKGLPRLGISLQPVHKPGGHVAVRPRAASRRGPLPCAAPAPWGWRRGCFCSFPPGTTGARWTAPGPAGPPRRCRPRPHPAGRCLPPSGMGSGSGRRRMPSSRSGRKGWKGYWRCTALCSGNRCPVLSPR